MLFDEPTSALDPEMIKEVLETMVELADTGMTMVVVTHDLASAFAISDRLLVLLDGTLRAQGSVAEIRACRDPDVAAFVGRQAAAVTTGGGDPFVARHFD